MTLASRRSPPDRQRSEIAASGDRILQTKAALQPSAYSPVAANKDTADSAIRPRKECPQYLGKKGREMWNDFLDGVEHKVVRTVFYGQLEVYISLFLRWKALQRRVEREGFITETVDDEGNIEFVEHPLLPKLDHMQTLLNRQFRTFTVLLTKDSNEISQVKKLEIAGESISDKSHRGALIGGDRYSGEELRNAA